MCLIDGSYTPNALLLDILAPYKRKLMAETKNNLEDEIGRIYTYMYEKHIKYLKYESINQKQLNLLKF